MAEISSTTGWHGGDGVARRTSPLTVAVAGASMVFGVIALLIGTVVQDAIIAAATSSGSSSSPFALLVPGLILLIAGAVQVVRWATTTYAVLPTELVVDSGVLNREHRVFPFARIQQADTHQNLIGQLIGVTELKIDVAGASGSNQLRLRLLDRDTAVALRDHILRRRAELHEGPGSSPAAGAPAPLVEPATAATWSDRLGTASIGTTTPTGEVEVLRIGYGRLALSAITHTAIVGAAPVVAIIAVWFGTFNAISGSNRLASFTAAGLAIGAGLLALVLLAAVGSTMLNLAGFVVSRAGDDIHLRYGLLETRNLTVPRRRVQQVTIVDNPLRRLAGLVEVHLHTAAAPGGGGNTRFTIPVIEAAEVDGLLRELMGDDHWRVPSLTSRSSAARRRAVTRRTAVVLLAIAVPAIALRPLGVALLALVPLGYLWGTTAHRRAGHGRSPEVVAFAHGVLHHRIDLVPIGRVQSGRTTQTIFQRRLDLATILLDVAGSNEAPELYDLELDTAAALRRAVPRASAPAAG